MEISRFRNEFQGVFGRPPEVAARAPGRVNLIGEHTDYNDGFVLPAAIDREVWVGLARRSDRLLRAYSMEHRSRATVSLDSPSKIQEAGWVDYPAGVAVQLLQRDLPVGGVDLLISGSIPIGAGLSSSAALLVATALAWLRASAVDLPEIEIIRLCRSAENDYVGLACGIMDHYVVLCGTAGHALFLDCRDLSSKSVRIPEGLSILVCDTGVRRALAASEYNRRHAECLEGVRLLARALGPISALRDVTPGQLGGEEEKLPRPVARRCRHVVGENNRVLEGVAALSRGDAEEFGRLMDESHRSLKEDYEVSCPELDTMVDLARSQRGVLGARMTGAGFGGCTVNLVRSDSAGAAAGAILEAYASRYAARPAAYVCLASPGASILF